MSTDAELAAHFYRYSEIELQTAELLVPANAKLAALWTYMAATKIGGIGMLAGDEMCDQDPSGYGLEWMCGRIKDDVLRGMLTPLSWLDDWSLERRDGGEPCVSDAGQVAGAVHALRQARQRAYELMAGHDELVFAARRLQGR
ncbi:hypothetical protein FHR90_003346 [Endobacter medicaginis]|uniref:Uncharacterized protein n=1 Tax=Endobacter medicaginis TaxID=1181271 RepID=A0A839V4K4_9PROT|nr:hypothetical protein [Endobacter medicaginis]MBB3175490.1 hypothetical protein [Endobacter medicaginis]MCX5476719.1 hypothetical protein [Endobacter medicaginis]NVN30028.1 hypothetical protein [Endobacter medicaginis]